jgi:16S rRNA processing protein RimM
MSLIRIGKIVNTQGLKGDVRIYPDTDDVKRFEVLEKLFVEGEDEPLYINRVWYKKNLVIVKFHGLDHINDVEKYKNKLVYTEKLSQEALEEDRYYVEDLIGMIVIDEHKGEIGVLKDIIKNPAHDLYLVKTPTEDILIPAVEAFILDVDLESRIIKTSLIEGFLS